MQSYYHKNSSYFALAVFFPQLSVFIQVLFKIPYSTELFVSVINTKTQTTKAEFCS